MKCFDKYLKIEQQKALENLKDANVLYSTHRPIEQAMIKMLDDLAAKID